MARSRVRTLDLVSKLGLRAAWTKKAVDIKAAPVVAELYNKAMDDLIKTHYVTEVNKIPSCPRLKADVEALCDKYGEQIWSRTLGGRPWLLDVGEGLYTKDLFYDDPQDRKFIQQTMHQIAVQRTLRYHKDNIREYRSSSSHPSWTPGAQPRSSSRPSNVPLMLRQCFAHPNIVLGRHRDATQLKEIGVWLGCLDDYDMSINGSQSYEDMERRLAQSRLEGIKNDPDLPVMFDEPPEMDRVEVCCAACGVTQDGVPMVVRCDSLTRQIDEDSTVVTNFWTFPCRLDGHKVFAIVKQEPKKRGSNEQLWSFWRNEGGHTNSIFLKSVETDNDTVPDSDQEAPRPPVTRGIKRQRASANSTHEALTARSATLGIEGSPLRPDVPLFELDHEKSHVSVADDRADEPPAQRRRQNSDYDELYDSTPAPQQQRRFQPINGVTQTSLGQHTDVPHEPHTAVQIYDRTLPMRPLSPAQPDAHEQPMGAPEYKHRFCLLLHVDSGKGRNAVYLHERMSVREVFEKLRRALKRQLQGRNLAAVAISLISEKQADEEEPLNLEIDDEDSWEAVLELVKGIGESRKREVRGHALVDN